MSIVVTGANKYDSTQVDEFVLSIVNGRKPRIDAVTAADWTAPGICAHQSAMKGGEAVSIPSFG